MIPLPSFNKPSNSKIVVNFLSAPLCLSVWTISTGSVIATSEPITKASGQLYWKPKKSTDSKITNIAALIKAVSMKTGIASTSSYPILSLK